MESPNVDALRPWLKELGMDQQALNRVYGTFNVNAEPFREESQRS